MSTQKQQKIKVYFPKRWFEKIELIELDKNANIEFYITGNNDGTIWIKPQRDNPKTWICYKILKDGNLKEC